MEISFYEKYKSLDKHELFKIMLNPNDYQAEAVEAAKRIIREKNWAVEYRQVLAKKTEEIDRQDEELRKENEEKAAYYKKAVEFQNQRNSFQVRTADIAKLEGALIQNNIEFFREDKHAGVQLDEYPAQSYYFKNEDLKEVDRITKEIGLRSATYLDHQQFFKFNKKVIIIVAIIIVILIFLLK